MKTTLDCIEIDPPQKAIGSVIWLHGLGADGSDFVPVVQELNLPSDLPLRFIFPHAPLRPVTVNNNYVMRAWFDIYSMDFNQRNKIDETGVADSIQQVEKLIEKEIQRGISSNKIILAGFSQGAAIALAMGLRYPKPLGGILALSGFLPHIETLLANEASPENFTTPIFLGHGSEDMIVPISRGQDVFNALEKNKYRVSWHSYPMPHSVSGEEIGDIAEWMRVVFSETVI
ncbi:MAG: alpha/beta hydrolase [Gammaproteobacteria bacterium]